MRQLQELTEQHEDSIEALPLMEALEEAVRDLNLRSKGGLIGKALTGAKDLFKANPELVTGASLMALSAITQYKKNQRNTIKLHAKTAYDKKMMTSIVDTLIGQGKFKVQRIKFEGGGKTWILRKKMS